MRRILQTILGSAILSLGLLIPAVRAAHLGRVYPEFRVCLEEALGAGRFDEMSHNQGAARTSEETFRMKSCGKMMEERLRKPTQTLVKLPPALGQCLHAKLGKAAFLAIKTGVRKPETEEHENGKACFKEHGAPSIPITPPSPQPPSIKGEGVSAPPPQELPADLRECLLKEFDQKVFSEIKLGKRQATSEEIEKGKVCMEKGQLPAPPPLPVTRPSLPVTTPPPPQPPPVQEEDELPPLPVTRPPSPVTTPPPPPQRVDQSWNKCMLELIGIDALRAITSGARSATPSELEAARICVSQ